MFLPKTNTLYCVRSLLKFAKRDSTLEEHYRFPDWLKFQPFIVIGWLII